MQILRVFLYYIITELPGAVGGNAVSERLRCSMEVHTMDFHTKTLLDQIVEDTNLLRKKMFFEADSNALATISAFLFASAGKRADIDKYVACRKYLRKHVNLFSEIRGIAETIVITKMCLADDYEAYLSGVLEVYKKLRKLHKLTASAYMVMTAINIFEGGGIESADANIEKLETVYKEMKADHFWLTDDADRPFIAMMVSRNIGIAAISSEISACYEACSRMSFSKEAMHSAAQIMSLSGKSVETKVTDMCDTADALKKQKLVGMKSDLMPVAAALGFVNASAGEKAKDIKEIYDYLKTQRGFKWYIGGTQRTLYSILAYALIHISGDGTVLNSVINSTLTNIIIDEIIMTTVVITAANSSHSSSSK